MKKQIVILLITLLAIAGCAKEPYKFNRDYLPTAVPGKPSIQIFFEDEKNQIIGKYLNEARYSNDLWLFWLAEDTLCLKLEGTGIIAIHPSTQKVNWLQDNKRNEIEKTISEKVTISNDAAEEALYMQVLSRFISSFGQQYSGKIIDNDHILKVNAKTVEKHRDNGLSKQVCTEAKLKVKLTDVKERSSELELEYNCDWLPQPVSDIKVPQFLRRFQISPSGNYYAYGSRLYRLGRKDSHVELMSDYPHISASINPEWTKIALLRNKGKQYCIEVFNIEIE